MKVFSAKYAVIAVFSLIILSTVQFFLLYNTYRIQSEHFYSNERDIVNNEYSLMIVNDKLYPGGSRIIDSIFYTHVDTLDLLYRKNKTAFRQQAHNTMESIFYQLKLHNNLDSVLEKIIKKNHHFNEGYRYVLIVKKFEIAFKKNNYIQIYPYREAGNDLYRIIGGSLSSPTSYNMVTGLSVSSPTDKSYRILFALHLENNNKERMILRNMMPMFLLSFCSITSIVVLFFITFNNWIKQKKLAEMQTDFINSISHEFNTPLTAIIIANKSIRNKQLIDQTPQLENLTGIIGRQTSRLNALFSQVLNLAKTNTSTLQKEKQDISILLSHVVNDYKTKITDRNNQLLLDNRLKENQILKIDIFWFTTMLQNIIENGFKYNNQTIKTVAIQATEENGKIIISIKDNGIGMSEKTQKRIFEKFYRHNNKLTTAGGLGLGLFYVNQCVRLHNWQIRIESKPSEGANFTIIL